jgi:hypothetical protein
MDSQPVVSLSDNVASSELSSTGTPVLQTAKRKQRTTRSLWLAEQFPVQPNGRKACVVCHEEFSLNTGASTLRRHAWKSHAREEPKAANSQEQRVVRAMAVAAGAKTREERSQEVDDDIVEAWVACNIAATALDNPAMRRLLIRIPYFQGMCADTYLNKRLPRRATAAAAYLRSQLAGAVECGVAVDEWSKFRKSFLAVVVQAIFPDCSMKRSYIAFKQIKDGASTANLSGMMLSALEDFGLATITSSITTDNAASVAKIASLHNWTGIRCICHTLQLCLTADTFNPIPDSVKHARVFLNKFHRSTKFNEKLELSQSSAGRPILSLKDDTITRWGSTFLAAERLLLIKDDIRSALVLIKQEKHDLSEADWLDLQAIADVSKLVHSVTLHFERTEAMISEVPAWISGLIEELTTLSVKSPRHNDICVSLVASIRTRFASVLSPKGFYVQATILDPRYKELAFLSPASREEAWLQFRQDLNAPSSNPSTTTASHPAPLVAKFVKGSRMPSDQISQYKALEQADHDANVVEWWLSKKVDFPRLFPRVLKMMAHNPSTAIVERVFSISGITYRERRNRLCTRKLESELFLKLNSDRRTEISYEASQLEPQVREANDESDDDSNDCFDIEDSDDCFLD